MTEHPFLDRTALAAALAHYAPAVTLHLYDAIDSTNSEAKRAAWAEAAAGLCPELYVARTQTGGRGRLGRSFHSPDTGLYMTLAYTTDRPLDQAVQVTVAAAVAAATAMEALTGKDIRIKWVNDLYLNGGKLAGILTETVPLAEGRTRVVVGIGINLTTTDFPEGLRAPAAALFEPAEAARATPAFRGELAGEIVRRLLDDVEIDRPDRTDARGDAREAAREAAETRLRVYRDRLLYIGVPVTCTRGNESFDAVPLGVDDDYSLIVDDGKTRRRLSSGEISVRPKHTDT